MVSFLVPFSLSTLCEGCGCGTGVVSLLLVEGGMSFFTFVSSPPFGSDLLSLGAGGGEP